MNSMKQHKLLYDCILRTAALPLNSNIEAIAEDILHSKDTEFHNNILNAIYIASPDLYSQLKMIKSGKITSVKRINRVFYSLYKYLNRMHFRVTPFGLFSTCSYTQFRSSKDNHEIVIDKHIQPFPRFDTNVLRDIVRFHNQSFKDLFNSEQQFGWNPTIYKVGRELRFYEKSYENDIVRYKLSAVNLDNVIEDILITFKDTFAAKELINYLGNKGYGTDSINEFVQELITSNILIPEMSLVGFGEDQLTRIINISKNNYNLLHLEQIKDWIRNLDFKKSLSNQVSDFVNNIKPEKFELNNKYLIQVDSTRMVHSASISKELLDSILEAIDVLIQLSASKNKNITKRLEEFVSQYIKRYGRVSMPLLFVMDSDIGLNYPIGAAHEKDNFIANIHRRQESVHSVDNIEVDKFNFIPNIELSNQYKSPMLYKRTNMSTTHYCIIENYKSQIFLKTIGGSTAGALISRFGYLNDDIKKLLTKIDCLELSACASDTIIAEINYFSDDTMGNILYRPRFRKYEIECINFNDKTETECLIPINDLYIVIEGDNRLKLYSKKLQKFVKPVLTSAHNYKHITSLPVYKFLCELQFLDNTQGIYCDFNELFGNRPFTPRVTYKNIILQKAEWKLSQNLINNFFSSENDLTSDKIKDFLSYFHMPASVTLNVGDSPFLINWHSQISAVTAFRMMKKMPFINFTENLFSDCGSSVVDSNRNEYSNEIILMLSV